METPVPSQVDELVHVKPRGPRRAAIARALASLAEAFDRDRFAGIDRRLMPDRLRMPRGIVGLMSFVTRRSPG